MFTHFYARLMFIQELSTAVTLRNFECYVYVTRAVIFDVVIHAS